MADTTATNILRAIIARFPQADPNSEEYDTGINGDDAVDFICQVVPQIKEVLDAGQLATASYPKSAKLNAEFLMKYFREQSQNPENETVCFCSEIADLICDQQAQIISLKAMVATQPDINQELLAACKALLAAQSSRRHPLGEPDEGIATMCAEAASRANAAIAKAATNQTSWNYHRDGEHPQFLKKDWRDEVAADDTILDYQEWVEHQVEAAEDEAEFAAREVSHEPTC